MNLEKEVKQAIRNVDADELEKLIKKLDKNGSGSTDELLKEAEKLGIGEQAQKLVKAMDWDKDGDITEEAISTLKKLKKFM
ncbi:MAG: hypothetical protein KBS68_05945 [Clostridiales bacterium]|nr:hypothetical protein [Candidatus Crickella merdequi]